MKRFTIHIIYTVLLCLALPASAQRFFNLTADEVKVDSVLPSFTFSVPLAEGYEDSLYTVSIKYPEYVDLAESDIDAYNRLSGAALPSQVVPVQSVSVSRRKASLVVTFSPLVFRKNRYQALASFMLDIKAKPLSRSARKARAASRAGETATYAAHSVLATGKWAKIRVSQTGIHELTRETIRKAGFSDLSKVRIYGYGGNLLNEQLYAAELLAQDDLHEVTQYVSGSRHFFYAKGPVSWISNTQAVRTRNPYSDYGYYFITETDDAPATTDSATFVAACYPAADDYHTLHETDAYSWYHGGRNLYDGTAIALGASQRVVVSNTSGGTSGTLTVNVTAGTTSQAEVYRNGTLLGTHIIAISSEYEQGGERRASYGFTDWAVGESDTITIKTTSGGPVRLDYISVAWRQPKPLPELTASVPAAEYVYNIVCQDHHADPQADMVIIIPTSQKLLAQAERLKAHHESHDSLRVNIVPADELYNEFSSGTPDAGAYRRYLRMLQDRAQTEADMPKYLLLFGDCVWDNRMLTSDCSNLSTDDYLLCYESENSFSMTRCYVSDSWLGILSEGAGGSPTSEQQDVAVGRFPVTTTTEAKVMVDKVINYTANENAGAWQNTIVMMGDDGNDNVHMSDENELADNLSAAYPGYIVRKIMWDAYTRESSSTGNTYPEVTRLIKQYQNSGALIMDYAGHGSETQISHETALRITDFETFQNKNLPLWVTASCDIMPFDGTSATIGEAAVLNGAGGAVAFYGTTRTVYTNYNKLINRAFLNHVLSKTDGKPTTIGEAHRLAQNELVLGSDRTENHLQYSLLGDPAMALNLPSLSIVIDSINGLSTLRTDTIAQLKAGSTVRMVGHIEATTADGQSLAAATDFSGVVTATVRDTKELVTCKLNDNSQAGASTAFTYYDRQKTLYQGSDSVRQGQFAFTFAVPKDINYADGTGLVNLYAVNTSHTLTAHGASEAFTVGGSEAFSTDSIGPSIYCYLNSPSFTDGGNVNTTPFFVAEITDKDGINAAGSGVGHDLQLTIDGDMSMTYNLNDNFAYDFGTYTSGSTYYALPELSEGKHTLQFRAWDILNNSSTVTLSFNVVRALTPTLYDVSVTQNPAKTSTTFIISHDRTESEMDVLLEVFDTSGRLLWQHTESGVPTSSAYTLSWDLTTDGGRPLDTGLYLYRVNIATDGSRYASKAKKLIVVR